MNKPSTRQKNKKSRIWIIIVAVIVIAALAVVYVVRTRNQASSANQYQTATAEKGTLTATIGATGTVRSNQTAILSWQTTGTVGAINVTTGDAVKAGDVLATILSSSLAQNIILAQSDLVSAQRNLENLMNSDKTRANAQLALANAQKAYDTAKSNRDRLNIPRAEQSTIDYYQSQVTLAEQRVQQAQDAYNATNGLSDADPRRANAYTNLYNAQTLLTQAQGNLNYAGTKPSSNDQAIVLANFAVATANLKDAQREWDRLKNGPDPNDIATAQARVNAAQAALATAQITAPFDGTVTEINAMVGDQVAPGVRAFRVDDLSSMLVDVQVSEVDINSVQVGQPVTITFDAISGASYHGKVVEVAQAGDVVAGSVTFTVTVQLTDGDPQVKPGMTAAVTITVKQLENVLLVPNRAVRVVNNQRVVYVLRNGQVQEIQITLGASSDTMSEVVSGDLQVGDAVILNPPSTLFNNPHGGGGGFGGGN